MSKEPRKLKSGATRRLEIHVRAFHCFTMQLSAEGIGELTEMLMAEVLEESVTPSAKAAVNKAFENRREFSRIRGGFGRSSLSETVRRAVYERDGGACRYCGDTIEWDNYHCDHVEPVKAGGSDDLWNLAASCKPCNLSKAAKSLKAWLQ